MKQHIDELLARIRDLRVEVEQEYLKAQEEFEQRRARLAGSSMTTSPPDLRAETGTCPWICASPLS